jgi:hypothetical protein
MALPFVSTASLENHPARNSAQLASTLRALQHELDALLTAPTTRVAPHEAYVLGRAVEGLAQTARLNLSAAVMESALRRLVRSVPPGVPHPALEQRLQEALALCLDPLPGADCGRPAP